MKKQKINKAISLIALVAILFSTTYADDQSDVKTHINNMQNSTNNVWILWEIFTKVFDTEGKIKEAFLAFTNVATNWYLPMWDTLKLINSPLFVLAWKVGIWTELPTEVLTLSWGLSLTKDPDSWDDVWDRDYNDARYVWVAWTAVDSNLLDGLDSLAFQRDIVWTTCADWIESIADNWAIVCSTSPWDTNAWTECLVWEYLDWDGTCKTERYNALFDTETEIDAAVSNNGYDTTVDTIADDGIIQETEIAQNTLDDSEIEDDSLTASSLAIDSVWNSELATSAVDSVNIVNDTITETDIIDSFVARDSSLFDWYSSAANIPQNPEILWATIDLDTVVTPWFYNYIATSATNTPHDGAAFWFSLNVYKNSSNSIVQESFKHENATTKKYIRHWYNTWSWLFTGWELMYHSWNDPYDTEAEVDAAVANNGYDTTVDTIADDWIIQETEIEQNSIDDSEIQDESITSSSLAANSVWASEIDEAWNYTINKLDVTWEVTAIKYIKNTWAEVWRNFYDWYLDNVNVDTWERIIATFDVGTVGTYEWVEIVWQIIDSQSNWWDGEPIIGNFRAKMRFSGWTAYSLEQDRVTPSLTLAIREISASSAKLVAIWNIAHRSVLVNFNVVEWANAATITMWDPNVLNTTWTTVISAPTYITVFDGNVWIWTDSPSNSLHVEWGTTIDWWTAQATNDATLYVTAQNDNDWWIIVDKYLWWSSEYWILVKVAETASHALRILWNGVEKFRVDGLWNLFISWTLSWDSITDNSIDESEIDDAFVARDSDKVDWLHATAIAQMQTATPLTNVDDLDALSDGWYSWINSLPTNAPNSYMILLQQSDAVQKIQMAFWSSATGKIYVRRADSWTFYPWTEFQQRVTWTCAAWNSIRIINSDWTVTCEADTDTQLSEATVDTYVSNNGYLTSYTETDPQVWGIVTSYIPRWNGTSLVTGKIFDNGTNVWIWTASPSSILEVDSSSNTVYNMKLINGWWLAKWLNIEWWNSWSDASLLKVENLAEDATFFEVTDWNSYFDNGNLWVWITNPSAKLHVQETTSWLKWIFETHDSSWLDAWIKIKWARNGSLNWDTAYIDFSDYDNDESWWTEYVMWRISWWMDNTSWSDWVLQFKTSDAWVLSSRMLIDSTGKIWIWTNSPVELLYVNTISWDARIWLNAPTWSDTEIKFSNNDIVDYTIWHDDATDNFVIWTTNVDTPLISVQKWGNVWIWTTTPWAKLDVNWEIRLSSDAEHSLEKLTTSDITWLVVDTTDLRWRNIDLYSFDDINLRAWSSDKITFHAWAAERMRINNSWNVWIWIISPNAKLDVNGSVNIWDSDSSYTSIDIESSTLAWYNWATQFTSKTIPWSWTAKYAFHFKTNESVWKAQADLIVDWNVWIWTTAPWAKLEVAFDWVSTTNGLKIDLASASSDTNLLLTSDDGTIAWGSDFIRAEDLWVWVFVLQWDWNMWVWTVSPTEKLTVSWDVQINWGWWTIAATSIADWWLKLWSTFWMDNNEFYYSWVEWNIGTIWLYDLNIQTNWTQRIKIEDTWNVWIWTSTPSEKLDVNWNVYISWTMTVWWWISGDSITDNTIDASEIQDNSLTSADINDNSLTSTDIFNNTIIEDDISDSFVARDSSLLDTFDSSQFLRSDTNDTMASSLTFSNANGILWESWVNRITHNDWGWNVQIRFWNDYSDTATRFTHAWTAYYIGWSLDTAGTSLDLRAASNWWAWDNAVVTWWDTLSIWPSTLTWWGDNVLVTGTSWDNIADGTIDSSEIEDNTIVAADIAAGWVWTSEILDNSISETDISDSFKARDSDKLDWIDSADFSKFSWYKIGAATGGAGWVTVAESSWTRWYSEVYVWDTESSDHAFMHLSFLRSYGGASVSVINSWGHAARITGARVIRDADDTYWVKKLQVYVTISSAYQVIAKDLTNISWYVAIDTYTPTLENLPAWWAAEGPEITGLTSVSWGIATTGNIKIWWRISAIGDPDSWDDLWDRDYNDARYINVWETWDSILDWTIDGTEIQDNSLTASDLAASSVWTSEVADNTLTASDLAAWSVWTSEVADNTLAAIDLATNACWNDELIDTPTFSTITLTTWITWSEWFSVVNNATDVYDDATSNSPYSRLNVDSIHSNWIWVGQTRIEWSAIDTNTTMRIWWWNAWWQIWYDISMWDNTELYIDTSVNNVWIWKSNPSAKLDVAGTILSSSSVTATSFIYSSDERLKENIYTLDNVMDNINKLRWVNFDWKENGDNEIGLIAQEVEEVYPELVVTNNDWMKAVKYGNIVAILIEWVKSLSNSIDDLFDKYLDQQEQIDNLEERLKQLEWYLAKG